MTTETETTQETTEWNDHEYRHCYRWIGGVWDGKPAQCGYQGPAGKKAPYNDFIPSNACPICLALFREGRK